jgi:hypothetical protein
VSAGGLSRRQPAVWLLLSALAAAIVVLEFTDAPEPGRPSETGRVPMFRFGEPDLGSVEAIYQARSATLMRDADGRWFQHDASHRHSGAASNPGEAHVADPERSVQIAEQLALTARMLADRRVRPEQSLDAYGLANPQTMIVFYGRTGDGIDYSRPLDVLYVGDLLPGEYAYYAMRDGDQELSLIPRYYIALLLALMFGEDQAPTPLPARQAASGN